MNNALLFHAKLSLKNTIKQALRKPLKMLGIVLAVAYFMAMPLFTKTMIVEMGLNTRAGYVFMSSVLTLYFVAPVTLTYFKRNGINFKSPDVNFMFATPISPKEILFYGLMRQVFLQVIMQIVLVIMAVYIFNIPILIAISYGLLALFLNSTLDYSLAILMYGSEKLSSQSKKIIKIVVYIILGTIILVALAQVYFQGFSLALLETLVRGPLVLFTPVFGWRLGLLNLMILGPNTVNIISTICHVIGSAVFLYLAINMKSTGDYYEDGIKFTEKQAILLEKKGKASFNDILGTKKKVNKYEKELKGSGAQIIFTKQWIEKRRTSKFMITLKDLLFLAISIGAGIFMKKDIQESQALFAMVCGVSVYVAVFFSPGQRWLDEFSKYFIYVMPQKNMLKLWYATLIEIINIVVQVLFLTVPVSILIQASPLEALAAIVTQIMMRLMLLYKSIFFEGYIGGKLGQTISQFISLGLTVILMVLPAVMIGLSLMYSYLISTLVIVLYSLIFTGLFMVLSAKALSNMENVKDVIQ